MFLPIPNQLRAYSLAVCAGAATVSCVHKDQGSPSVLVSAFTEPDFAIDGDSSICFADFPPNASLEKKSRHRDLVRICSKIAEAKGVTVVKVGSEPKCLITSLGWYAGEGQSFYLGSSTSCSSVYGTVFCNSHNRGVTYYSKGIQIDFAGAKQGKTQTVHEIRATLTSNNPGFRDATAVALCRAAFHDFPEKLVDKSYVASTSMPGSETFGDE